MLSGSDADYLALELLVGACYATVGYGLFRVMEQYIRRSGAYELQEA
jgi:hypothetical protein